MARMQLLLLGLVKFKFDEKESYDKEVIVIIYGNCIVLGNTTGVFASEIEVDNKLSELEQTVM